MTSIQSDDAVPRVSIVIPCYNGAQFLEECARSALTQDIATQVIIVDDGSTDDSLAIARAIPGVTALPQANTGVSAARNRGLAAAIGDYVIFLDADDRLLPDGARHSADALDDDPARTLVFGSNNIIDPEGNILRTNMQRARPFGQRDVFFQTVPSPSQAMVRRATAVTVGGFREGLANCEDFEFYLRLLDRGMGYCHGHLVTDYRKHPGQATKHAARSMLSGLALIDEKRATMEPGRAAAIPWGEVRRTWQRSGGRFIPYEIYRYLRTRHWRDAAAVTGTYLRNMPATGIGTLELAHQLLRRRLGERH